MTFEETVIHGLIHDEKFARKILPHIKADYFEGPSSSLFRYVSDFIAKYNKLPNPTVLEIEFKKSKAAEREDANEVFQQIQTLRKSESEKVNYEWLLDECEVWCKQRSAIIGVIECVEIIDGKNRTKDIDAIPDLMTKALSVTFDTSVGHDYLEDAEARFESYVNVEEKIPFDLEMFNKITNGGVSLKTLNVVMASCVHPDTPIKIRYSKVYGRRSPFNTFVYDMMPKIVPISKVSELLDHCIVEVDSPDGWIEISDYVTKGTFPSYELTVGDKTIICNRDHRFETDLGWQTAQAILEYQNENNSTLNYLTPNGFAPGKVEFVGEEVPIVDIQVEHENHRYYTNGVSSHNTGAGKSMLLCHLAAASLRMGKNVLYISLEMSEDKLAARIDANLLDIDIQDLPKQNKASFISKVAKLKTKTHGKLVLKEYPTSSAHVGHFRALISELKMKKEFIPDIIFVDYLNICASSKTKLDSGGSYGYIKSIAEEIRALAVETNTAIWSATQTNRSGFDNTDVDLTNTSESIGMSATVDLQVALIATDEMKEQGTVMLKQLKNRYNDMVPLRFMLGCERSKMRMYDLDDQDLIGAAAAPVAAAPPTAFANKPKADSDVPWSV